MDASAIPPALSSGSPALFKRTIALSLIRWRLDAKKTVDEAAKRIGRTRQHISNLEGGERFISASDLEVLLGFYDKADRLPFMLELLNAAKKATNWWTQFSGAVPKWFDLFLGLESGTAELSSFDTVVVPGLLQTRAYAEAVIRGNPDLTSEQVEQLVDLRMSRQHILDRPNSPVRLWRVLDESVLYRRRGDAAVMRDQLAHLLELSERPRIDIQVLPLDAGSSVEQDCGTFTVMKFPPEMESDPGVVYIEMLTGGQYIEKPEHIAVYQRALTRLHSLAADPRKSRAIIKKAMKEVTT